MISAISFTAPVNVDDATIQKSAAGVISIKPNGVDNAHLKDNAVDTAQLKANGVTSPKLGTGTLNLVAETIVSGGAVTQIDFTGLDLDTAKTYLIFLEVVNATASNANLKLYLNGDATDANYYSQVLIGDGAGVSAARVNRADIGLLYANKIATASINLFRTPDGFGVAQSFSSVNEGSTISIQNFIMSTSATISNIISLSIVASAANVIANDSVCRIYEVSS